MSRPKWNGNIKAQEEADAAWKKLKDKNKKPRKMRTRRQRKQIFYEDYLKSKKWARKRASFIKASKNKCSRCGTSVKLEVHHRHYETLGKEKLKDVEVVCESCHKMIHA